MSWTRAVVVFGVWTALLGCSKGFLPFWPQSKCNTSSDCLAGFACQDGSCVQGETTTTSSSTSSSNGSSSSGMVSSSSGSSGGSGTSSSGMPVMISMFGVGFEHVCATKGGLVRCQGNSEDSRLGGAPGLPGFEDVISSNGSWANITAGRAHTCAVNDTGQLLCWGSNVSGEIGQPMGTPNETSMPLPVGGADWVVVKSFWEHTCGIKRDGNVRCWGRNDEHQLGSPLSGTTVYGEGVSYPHRAQDIAVGRSHTCLVRLDGQLWCWGTSAVGALGLGGTFSEQTTPAQVMGASNWRKVCAGQDHTCAINATGQLYCWGQGNRIGQASAADQFTPLQVGTNTNWTAVACGVEHTCALTSQNALYCFGENAFGQLGGGDLSDQPTPHLIAGSWEEVAAGPSGTTCGVTLPPNGVNRIQMCWGNNDWGQITGVPTTQWVPGATLVGTSATPSNQPNLSAGDRHACALRGTGEVDCWGFNRDGAAALDGGPLVTMPMIAQGGTWSRVAAGRNHSCALHGDGGVRCWGRNDSNELGGAVSQTQVDTQLGNTSQLAAASGLTCVLVDQSVLCSGALPGDAVNAGFLDLTPDGGVSFVTVAAGAMGVFAVTSMAQVVQRSEEAGWTVLPLPAFTRMSIANQHACGLLNGQVFCWGDNSAGALGGPLLDAGTLAVAQPIAGEATSVCAAGYHACAVLMGGTMLCWGANGSGQLGLSSRERQVFTPQVVGGGPAGGPSGGWNQVTCGQDFTCGLLDDGGVRCWGNGAHGQLGHGRAAELTPTPFTQPRSSSTSGSGGMPSDSTSGSRTSSGNASSM